MRNEPKWMKKIGRVVAERLNLPDACVEVDAPVGDNGHTAGICVKVWVHTGRIPPINERDKFASKLQKVWTS